jgi:hypothetical protein
MKMTANQIAEYSDKAATKVRDFWDISGKGIEKIIAEEFRPLMKPSDDKTVWECSERAATAVMEKHSVYVTGSTHLCLSQIIAKEFRRDSPLYPELRDTRESLPVAQ